MPLEIKCESCAKRYRVDEGFAGKRVKCRDCGAVISVPADTEPDLSAPSSIAIPQDTEGESLSSYAGAYAGAQAPTDRPIAASGRDDGHHDESDRNKSEPLPAGFGAALKMARSRGDVRPFRLLTYPGVKAVDAALPWVMGALCLIPVIWQGINIARATSPAWITFTMFGLTFLLFLAIVVPATTRGLRVASQMLHFELPDSAGRRTLGVFSLPFALAAIFYWQMEGMSGLIFGLALGVLLVGPLLLIVMQLHWVEAVVAWMMGSLFFAGSVAVTAGVLFVVGLVITAATAGNGVKPPPRVIAKTSKPAAITATTEPVVQGPIDVPPTPVTPPVIVPTTEATSPAPDNGGFLGSIPVAPPPPPVVTAPTNHVRPPDPAVPKAEHVSVAPSPIVKTVRELEAFGDIDSLLVNDAAGGAVVALKRSPDADKLVALDLAQGKPSGEVSFKRDIVGSDRYLATPAGDAAIRVASWPKLRVEVLPLGASRQMKALNLNEQNGTPTMLGVGTNEVLLVGWQFNGQYAIEPWNLKTGLAGRGFHVPPLVSGASALSSDGKWVALATKIDNLAQLQLYEVLTGRFRKFPITSLDTKWPLEPAGLAFSPDSSRLAICFERDGGVLVVAWNVATGKQVAEQVYVAGMLPIPMRTSFNGRALDWVGDNTTWLLFGQTLVDATSGAVLGPMGIDRVTAQHVIDAKTIVLEAKLDSGAKRLVELDLNSEAITKIRPAAPK